jgi:hypothetical protein
MGTRNLTMVVLDGELKVSQYGQWDGYPGGQGAHVIEFLSQEGFDLEKFKQKVADVVELTFEEVKERWVEAGADPDSDMVSMDVSNRFKELYPELSRDTGAGVLEAIYNTPNPIGVRIDNEFMYDSLFCEWGWLINLDNNTLEMYCGFNHEPLEEGQRFYKENQEPSNAGISDPYYAIKMVKAYPLDDLPTVEQMEKDSGMYDEEDEDELD